MRRLLCIVICILTASLYSSTLRAEEEKWMEFHNRVPIEAYNKVFAIGKDTVFLVGEKGVIVRSLNGFMESWDQQVLPGEPSIKGLYFRNSKEALIAGGKQIYRTMDGGEHWNLVYTDSAVVINSVWCVGTTDCVWAVGNKGRVIKSQDFGETWNNVAFSNVETDLNGISMNTKGYGLITGNKLTLLTTFDSGKIWEIKQNVNANSWDQYVFPQIGDSIGVYGRYGMYASNFIMLSSYYYNFRLKKAFQEPSLGAGLYLKDDTTIVHGAWRGDGMFSINYIGRETWLNNQFKSWDSFDVYIGYPPGVTATMYASIHYGDSKTGYLTDQGTVLRSVPEGYDVETSIPKYSSQSKPISYRLKEGVLYLEQENTPIGTVTIYDVQGRKQFMTTTSDCQTQVRVSNFPKGIYVVNLRRETGREYSFKISVP